MAAVQNARVRERLAGVGVALLAVVHDVVVLKRHSLHAVGGQRLHILRRRGEGIGVLRRALRVGQRALEVDDGQVVGFKDRTHVFQREAQAGGLLGQLLVKDARGLLARVAADGHVARGGEGHDDGAVVLRAPVGAVRALIPRARAEDGVLPFLGGGGLAVFKQGEIQHFLSAAGREGGAKQQAGQQENRELFHSVFLMGLSVGLSVGLSSGEGGAGRLRDGDYCASAPFSSAWKRALFVLQRTSSTEEPSSEL